MINGVIIRPTGNDTAIVESAVVRSMQKEVSLAIQRKFPNVEQVAFSEGDYLQMAGGEFCGNAARAFGYLKSNGEDASVKFKMSGTTDVINVVIKDHNSKLVLPINLSYADMVSVVNDGVWLAKVPGITHLVITENSELFNRQATDDYVLELMDKFNLRSELAAGVMFWDTKKSALFPHVFVRDTGTLYAETACGSGTIACALTAKNNGVMTITQPSGMALSVSVLIRDDIVLSAAIDGPVQMVERFEI